MKTKVMVFCFAVALVAGCSEYDYHAVPVERTPYDTEWEAVRRCLLETARLRYHRDAMPTWKLPTTTVREGQGDCTALATLLYQKMLGRGVKDGRIVFGYHGYAWHAWVQWRGYVLDPTISGSPIRPFGDEYRPYWGYDMASKYRFIEVRREG